MAPRPACSPEQAPTGPIEVIENGLHFAVDLEHGQKTGFYTDQRQNRRRFAAYCKPYAHRAGRGPHVLNAFAYTGAFAVYALAAGAAHVINIDSSVEALELAETNLRLNGFDPDSCRRRRGGRRLRHPARLA